MRGMTNQQAPQRIYFDANALIYAIEGVDEVARDLHSLFGVLRQRAKMACTSEFTLAEVLPKANGVQRRSYFTLMLHSGVLDLLPVTREILIETADYRKFLARPSFDLQRSMPKLPDAIHIVTAVNAKCDTFVSFDRGLKLPEGLSRVGREDGRLLQLIQDMM
ncbi:PilT protein-like [Rhodopseudomonas palustris BisB5]|uniref:PilT protein-like n=1 Tax=Rhodopseudomonas palustris (strain BisB5) TaxID=316057 RepID=Q133I5_RHOPS|nr:PilT protein-like [Rhodopseudomonas palustris BisB5]